MAKKKQKISPSQARYNSANPVVSIRVPKEVREKLEGIRERAGMSWADLVLDAVEPALARLEAAVEAMSEETESAYNRGWAAARDKYRLAIPCNVCGKVNEIGDPDSMRVVKEILVGRVCCEGCFRPRS